MEVQCSDYQRGIHIRHVGYSREAARRLVVQSFNVLENQHQDSYSCLCECESRESTIAASKYSYEKKALTLSVPVNTKGQFLILRERGREERERGRERKSRQADISPPPRLIIRICILQSSINSQRPNQPPNRSPNRSPNLFQKAMCQTQGFESLVCHHRWLTITLPCGPDRGFDNCSRLVRAVGFCGTVSWFPATVGGCPVCGMKEMYDGNKIRMVMGMKRGVSRDCGSHVRCYQVVAHENAGGGVACCVIQ
jgi:hypothetical protein